MVLLRDFRGLAGSSCVFHGGFRLSAVFQKVSEAFRGLLVDIIGSQVSLMDVSKRFQ